MVVNNFPMALNFFPQQGKSSANWCSARNVPSTAQNTGIFGRAVGVYNSKGKAAHCFRSIIMVFIIFKCCCKAHAYVFATNKTQAIVVPVVFHKIIYAAAVPCILLVIKTIAYSVNVVGVLRMQ